MRRRREDNQKSFGDAKFERDNLGQIVVVPYFCRYDGCEKGWPNKRARLLHERTHNGTAGRPAGPQPPIGTLESYYWHRRNKLETPQVDKDKFNAYMREYNRRPFPYDT